jgi:hypothetical protein
MIQITKNNSIEPNFTRRVDRHFKTLSALLLAFFFLSGCGGSSSGGDSLGDFFISLLNGQGAGNPSTAAPSPQGQGGPNTPAILNPPDEVLATNPPPPAAGEIIEKEAPGGGPIIEFLGPQLKLEIDSINYSLGTMFDFLGRQVGSQEDKMARITNEGDRDLVVSFARVESSADQFTFVNSHGYPGSGSVTLSPGQSRQFTIRFQPAIAGLRRGTLTIQSNDQTRPFLEMELRGSGTAAPTATVLKPANAVSRYQRIVIEFSHEMDRGTVCNGANGIFGSETYSHRGGGNQIRVRRGASIVQGRCTWTGFRQLVLQPYSALDEFAFYDIDLEGAKVHSSIESISPDGGLYCVGLPVGACSTTKITQFQTEPSFQADLSVNTRKVVGAGAAGLVMDKSIHPTVTLTGSVTSSGVAAYIRLKKVGALHTSFANFSASMNLSTITPADLRPTDGANGYYLEISYGGKLYYRNFGFNYGTPQPNPGTTAVAQGGSVAIGTGNTGVDQIKDFLIKFVRSTGDYTSGNFRLSGKIFDNFYKEPVAPAQAAKPHKRTTHCIDYELDKIKHVRQYGDASPPIDGLYGDGYCGGAGANPGAFQASGCGTTFDLDAYVSDIRIPRIATTTGGTNFWNIDVTMATKNAASGGLEIGFYGRYVEVDLDIIARNRGLCLIVVTGGNRFHFKTKAILNLDHLANLQQRLARAKTDLTVLPDGRLKVTVKTPYGTGNTVADNFYISEWTDAINVAPVEMISSTSWVANILGFITEAIGNGMIPTLKPLIVRGILRDFNEKIAPDALNALFTQLRTEPGDLTPNGIGVQLPDYLPPPFNRTKLYVGANLRFDNVHRTGTDGIDLAADVGILTCVNPNPATDTCLPSTPGISTLPALHTGGGFVDSFMLSGLPTPRSQLASGPVNGNSGSGAISDYPGVLLAVKVDVINQVLYGLWKKGVFELSLDQSFADAVQAYRGSSDRLFQIFQILLKADAILKVIAPGQSEVFYGPGPNDKIDRNDGIIFRLVPITPPNVKPASLAISKDQGGGKRFALADLEWSDLRIQVYGRRADNSEYLITTLKANFRSRAGINIHRFTSPVNGGSNDYRNVTSIQLNVCDDNVDSPSAFDCDLLRTSNGINDDLVYTLEILDNPIDNPLGLDPRGIYEVLEPSVQKLILPVVNFVLEELPLEKKSFALPSAVSANQPGTREDPNHPDNKIMANCGIRLENMSVKPIPSTEVNPYILIHTELVDYTFSGNCQL